MPGSGSRETSTDDSGTPISDAALQAIAARCEAATPGPWKCVHSRDLPEPIVVSDTVLNRRGSRMIVAGTRWPLASLGADEATAEANARFVAAARSDVPRLVQELRRLQGMLAETLHSGDAVQGRVGATTALGAPPADARGAGDDVSTT